MNTTLIAVGVGVACLLVGLVHWFLARLAPVWPGALVPALWAGAAVFGVVTGRIQSLVDVGGVLLVGVVLARIWHEGRQKRATRSAPTAAHT
jgi:hypothetical protein